MGTKHLKTAELTTTKVITDFLNYFFIIILIIIITKIM